MTITIRNGHLVLQPSTHPSAGGLTVSFQRTLRIPDDGRTYPLPPGLGEFPLRHVRDYAHRVPAAWAKRGGVLLPMYQREAMWLAFNADALVGGAPHALQVGIGKVCAVSGERWTEHLQRDPQNYVVTGTQPWLDGIASGKGTIRQFVAVPLGKGLTVEAQLTDKEEYGGLQLQAFAPKPGRIPRDNFDACGSIAACDFDDCEMSMGLGAGGTMEQKVYPDPYGIDVWDPRATARVYVHIVNSELWHQITGEAPPPSPVTARSYIDAGLPWFSLYDEHAQTLAPTAKLAGVKSIDQLEQLNVKKLPWQGGKLVDDGEW